MTLLRTLLLACILAVVSFSADARTRHVDSTPSFDRHTGSNEIGSRMFIRDAGVRKVRHAGFKQMRRSHQKRQHRDNVTRTHAAKHHHHGGVSASLADVTPQLAFKAREIIEACGAKVISGYRPGARVRGYGTPSLHSRYPAEAIDMTGDTSCIYPRLKGWAGGYSVDYAAVRHIHISLASDRRERGSRFAHYGTRRYARAR